MSKLYTQAMLRNIARQMYSLGKIHGARGEEGHVSYNKSMQESEDLLAGLLDIGGLSQDRPRQYQTKKGRFRS